MQDSADKKFAPDRDLIKQHLEFIVSGMERQFGDGFIEIAYGNHDNDLNQAQKFALDQIDAAVDFAVDKNSQRRNVYTMGAILSPDAPVDKRSTDDDFYACNAVWCDIDDAPDLAFLRNKYKDCPPSKIIVTGRHPNLRIHLWWKLDEAIEDHHELRIILRGIQESLGGDPKTTNECRLMRIGGSVAWPVKKKAGRITEQTEVTAPVNAKKEVNAELLKRIFPSKAKQDDDITHDASKDARHTKSTVAGLQPETVVDGRDAYMSDMAYASVINLAGEHGRWPTAQEVFDDVWPVYSARVKPRDPRRTLDDEGRGAECLKHKIKSKLRGFSTGRMRITLEQCKAQYDKRKREEEKYQGKQQSDSKEKTENASHETNTENKKKTITYTLFDDIKPCIDANDFVQGYFGKSMMSVVYGESNCGKTFFMMDLAFHVAMGRRWRDKRVDKGGVIYVALEGSYGLSNRLAAFKKEYPEMAAGMPLAMIASQIDFTNPEGNISEFIEVIKELKQKLGSVQLIVIDTLARALLGGDENDGKDMGMLVAHGDKIRLETGAHVCFVHHSGKDKAKGARGHSSLRAAVDTEIEVSREEGAEYSTVRTAKQRDMEATESVYFGLKQVSLGVNKHNEEIMSCVVVPMDEDNLPTPKTGGASLTPMQTFVFDAICAAMGEAGRPVTIFPNQAPIKCIDYEKLRTTLMGRGFAKMVEKEADTPEKMHERVKSATQTARMALLKKNKIGFNRNYIWLMSGVDASAASAPASSPSYEPAREERVVNKPYYESEFPE